MQTVVPITANMLQILFSWVRLARKYSARSWNFFFQEPHFHSKILELHGFNFELKATRRDEAYFFSIKVSMYNF